jgi:hypothetical protein
MQFLILLFFVFFIPKINSSNVPAEPQILFVLEYPNEKKTAEYWQEEDFEKIPLFKNIKEDFSQESTSEWPVPQEKPYLTHEYFRNLITGNFVDHGLTRYVNDYNFFIGNDIQLPRNEKYLPFPTSLKWKVFKDNEDFFRIKLDDKAHFYAILKNFLYYDFSKLNPDEIQFNPDNNYNPTLFYISMIDLSPTQDETQCKLSLKSPYLIDYDLFNKLDEKTRTNTTWINLNKCLLFDLNLSTLFNYFPNLHKLTVKNTFIKTITNDDIEALKTIRNKHLASNETTNNFFDAEGQMRFYELFELKNSGKVNEGTIQKIDQYSIEKTYYSFVLDLNGCPIQEATFGSLENIESDKIYEKEILIRGSKRDQLTNQRSQFQTLLLKLLHLKKYISAYMIFSIGNLFFIKILYVRNPSTFSRALIVLYAVISLAIKYVIAGDLCRTFSCINTAGVIFD